jgi:UDP-N-acetylmuramoyl-tripeptide--D-alanyl-D-alanine ligase
VLNLKDIVKALTQRDIPQLDVNISGVVIDSRTTSPGNLFVALPGEQCDGHDYVQNAFDNGAVLAFVHQDMAENFNILDLRQGKVDHDEIDISTPICLRVENTLSALQTLAAYWRTIHPVRTIGITGSVGKTTTKELTAFLLSQKYSVLKNPGNRNNEIGLPLTLMELEDFHEYAVLEMGFYVPGDIRTLCDIAQPHVGVLTNIGTVHAERAGSQEIIAKGKAELVESLPPAPEGLAILNMDDPLVKAMGKMTHADIFSYGIRNEADLRADNILSQGLNGISLELVYQGEAHRVQSPLLGEFSAYTVLRAAAVAFHEGLDWDTITVGLARGHIDLRMRQFTLPNGAVILDDTYNASPASTTAALQLLNDLEGRKIAILGDMLELGPYEQTGHADVGKFAAKIADILILVGQRSKTTAKSALESGFSEKNLYLYPTSKDAADPAARIVQGGDVVLIKGSNSMQMDQIITALEGIS